MEPRPPTRPGPLPLLPEDLVRDVSRLLRFTFVSPGPGEGIKAITEMVEVGRLTVRLELNLPGPDIHHHRIQSRAIETDERVVLPAGNVEGFDPAGSQLVRLEQVDVSVAVEDEHGTQRLIHG